MLCENCGNEIKKGDTYCKYKGEIYCDEACLLDELKFDISYYTAGE